ncbi:MAG: MBL fold metallo-hydrolase [Deltaproteobacteria bacterium]|nr:MBL fold metallo-hydrolase [Deltaproteobacteria bacterium]MBK8713895.1 MBL fold metallo-hydrolase [Deltaproteobacteria bacterium]MBP7290564.1 MBL fold metallo-hydrolase [Nannocystaceae bacterium]
MRVDSVQGNTQKLDGGAMFGNAPKAVWSRWCPADERNRIALACRAMLVREDGRNVLLETGIGAFFEPALRERFGVVEDRHVLLDSLATLGLSPSDVDVIVLSHLHFDHAGGLLAPWRDGGQPELVFDRAQVVVGREAWARANAPHARDRASFIPELQPLLEATGRLEIVEGERSRVLGDDYSFSISHGHTPGLLLTRVATPHGPITFMGDLVPGAPWVHLPITTGYDRYPELLIDEKQALLEQIRVEHGWVFFTHDAEVAAARVELDDKRRYRTVDALPELHWA